jgi:tRNA pseudouridine38-40 synthase
MSAKFAVLISYAGTQYCGWQSQKRPTKGQADAVRVEDAEGFPSIQATVQAALARITREEVSVVGSGRTDSGVHALGQVAHFVLHHKVWDPEILCKGLNSALPSDIRAREVVHAHPEFHAQRSALRKQYSYYFQQGSCAIPHLLPYSRWIKKKLDLEAMNHALAHLVGEHEFKPFQASGAKPGPTIRRIIEADARIVPIGFPGESDGVELIRMRVLGTGFLKQMVRGIAGTLLQVGEGRRDPDCTREILRSGDRKAVGPTAPARALWLEKVWYPEELVRFSGC